MPSLRERKEDIPLLAEHFLRTFAKAHKKGARSFTPGYLSALSRHPWPGNVRELQNIIERSIVLANGNEYLGVSDLPEELRELTIADENVRVGSFHESVQAFKKELVRSALRMHEGNRMKAAVELGISRCYLHRLLNQFNLADEEAAQQQQLEEEDDDAPIVPDFKEAPLERHRMTVRIG